MSRDNSKTMLNPYVLQNLDNLKAKWQQSEMQRKQQPMQPQMPQQQPTQYPVPQQQPAPQYQQFQQPYQPQGYQAFDDKRFGGFAYKR